MITRIAVGVVSLLAGSALGGSPPGFFSDPVVTYTNGMRLASSTSLRSHNVYWQCDKGHVGYCDGCLHSPCRDDWRSLGTRCHGKYRPPYTPMGATGSETVHAMDGIEPGSSVSLGLLVPGAGSGPSTLAQQERAEAVPADPSALDIAAPSAEPAGGIWLDAIQTIGRKMMADPES